MTKKHFIVRRRDVWEDSWTYGDWRQYVCRRPDGALQCARPSAIPLVFAIGSVVLSAMASMSAAFAEPGSLAGDYAGPVVATAIASGLAPAALVAFLRKFAFMVAVGPRQYNGRRVFNHEVEK